MPGIIRQKKWKRNLDYNLRWHEKAVDDLRGLDRKLQKKIVARIRDYMPKDPIALGKPLTGVFKGFHRYRYGDYRIIYAVDQTLRTVMILRVGNRKTIHDRP